MKIRNRVEPHGLANRNQIIDTFQLNLKRPMIILSKMISGNLFASGKLPDFVCLLQCDGKSSNTMYREFIRKRASLRRLSPSISNLPLQRTIVSQISQQIYRHPNILKAFAHEH